MCACLCVSANRRARTGASIRPSRAGRQHRSPIPARASGSPRARRSAGHDPRTVHRPKNCRTAQTKQKRTSESFVLLGRVGRALLAATQLPRPSLRAPPFALLFVFCYSVGETVSGCSVDRTRARLPWISTVERDTWSEQGAVAGAAWAARLDRLERHTRRGVGGLKACTRGA